MTPTSAASRSLTLDTLGRLHPAQPCSQPRAACCSTCHGRAGRAIGGMASTVAAARLSSRRSLGAQCATAGFAKDRELAGLRHFDSEDASVGRSPRPELRGFSSLISRASGRRICVPASPACFHAAPPSNGHRIRRDGGNRPCVRGGARWLAAVFSSGLSCSEASAPRPGRRQPMHACQAPIDGPRAEHARDAPRSAAPVGTGLHHHRCLRGVFSPEEQPRAGISRGLGSPAGAAGPVPAGSLGYTDKRCNCPTSASPAQSLHLRCSEFPAGSSSAGTSSQPAGAASAARRIVHLSLL